MAIVWTCCIRHSNTVPLGTGRPTVFNSVNETRPVYSNYNYTNYGAIGEAGGGDVGATEPGGDDKPQWRRYVCSSSVNLFSVQSLQAGFNDASLSQGGLNAEHNDVLVRNGTTGGLCCCCCGGRPNEYLLRRMARLLSVIPAAFLVTGLIMNSLLGELFEDYAVGNRGPNYNMALTRYSMKQ